MTWQRAPVADALVSVLTAATNGTVSVHDRPPETVNPMSIVVGRAQPALYSTVAPGVDDVTLPIICVGGVETDEQTDQLKETARQAIFADRTLGGVVQNATPTEERNWRNITGAGGIQLLIVELIVQIQM